MSEAFIYDHVRTPRGRGKADGSLHEVTALALATVPLKALKERNNLAEGVVDDVILGVVDPVGEAGSDIARFAALEAGLGEAVPGVQISRFCASGLDAVNFAAAQIMSGQNELAIGGGAESMSRVGIGASGGAWPMDPSIAVPSYFMPQGISADLIATKYGFSRDDVDAYAVQSQQRAAKAWDEGRFNKSVVPVKDVNGLTILAKDEHMRPSRRCSRWPSSSRLLPRWPRWAALMASRSSRIRKSSASTTSITPATRPASSMARAPCCLAARRRAASTV
jgi:acetyl-CoA C-acetyltransferase